MARGQKKKRPGKGPRGRPSWVVGTKFIFLNQYADDWLRATDQGVVVAGRFYTKITKRFIKKYGWHFDRWEDKECDDLDEETMDDEDLHEDVDNEERVQRSVYYNQLREVIMAWYHTFNKKVNSGNSFEIEKAFHEMTETIPTAPKIVRTDQFYSRKYYKTRIKAVIDAEWELAKDTLPEISHIKFSNNVTNRIYKDEPESFKARLEMERQAEHAEDMAEYNRRLEGLQNPLGSAEAFHDTLGNAAGFLQPFSDLMAKKFGAAVSILMVCPIGTSGGEIELRSVHSGVTNELVPQQWPTFDHVGFEAVQRSMVNFGAHVFSLADQNARSLTGPRQSTVAGLPIPSTSSLTPPGPSLATASPTFLTPQVPAGPHVPLPAATPPAEPLAAATPPVRPPTLPPAAALPVEPPAALPAATPLVRPPTPLPVAAPAASAPTPLPATTPPVSLPALPPLLDTPPAPSLSEAPLAFSPGSALPPPPIVVPLPPLPFSEPSHQAPATSDDIPESSRVRYSGVLDAAHLWGNDWLNCVNTFIEFERAAGFTAKETRLPTSHLRPPEIQIWFETRRKMNGLQWDEKLCKGDSEALGESWWDWWRAIQPSQRGVDENQIPSRASGDCEWSSIRKPGGSGIFMVLLVLVWWRKRLDMSGKGADDKRWRDAVDDATWVLRHLKEGHRHTPRVALATKKRKATAELDVESSLTARRVSIKRVRTS